MQIHASRNGSSRLGFGDTETLTAALRATVQRGTGGVIYIRADGTELRQSYKELLAEAGRIAGGLRASGVSSGDPVLLQLEAGEDFIPGFWGCVLAGAIAVPVAVAPTFSHPNSALQKLLNAAKLFDRAPVLASGAAVAGLRQLPVNLGTLGGAVLDLGELRHASTHTDLPQPKADDVAVLLLTSGSTGQPKGVPLTHRNLLAMAAGTAEANEFTSAEVTLNWMALDHVGSVSFLGTMAAALGCTQIHVPTGYILQKPLRWLDLISRHRATISWAPNFAFTLFLDRAAAVQAGKWDLSSMRFLVNAGEPVVARTARKFITLLQGHGLPVAALRPAFGMSETCSGITWSRGLTLENTTDDQAFVDLGPAIPGAEMRVVNDTGVELPEGESGMLQLRGASVFRGYYRNPEENARVFKDGWFETGDLAFLKDGCLYIAGRLKDVIIVNGANFYCHEIETAAETVPGLIKTHTAACAVRDASAETDQLALFFCLDAEYRSQADAVARSLRARLLQQVGLAPAYLVALETSEVPKTEIGKIQRAQLKKAFEAGAYRDRAIGLTRATPAKSARPRAKSRSELTSAIAEIWQEVLGLERVGLDETFFELGGHSLLIVQVQVRLQELVGRAVPVVELFNCPTVRTMAEHFAKDFAASETLASDSVSSADRARAQGGDVAIVGIGLRFPGGSTPEEFWRLLADGREAITFFTAEEALAAGVDPDLVRNPNHVRAAPLLDAPDEFDAEFFRYNAKEARMLDPQQRVFLEVCWEAFEDAGYDPLTFPGKVGLFAAAGMNAYLPNNLWANDKFLQDENGGRMLTVDSMNGFNVMITNDKDYLPMRVSYKLNLRGPSVNVQSACSSTLLTLHEACKSLRNGDCEMALAGGVSIKLPQHAGHLYSPGMLNSPDGHCRAYDEKAEGTIFGNGAGVVLLKPLSAALAAGDRIYAVVKGTASNNDGAGKVGFTAPSSAGQEDVCTEAMARAGVSAESVTFVEGHGTGTALGDPIEVNALASAFRRHTTRAGFCALGSVKTNVGHLQIASGIAGLIKTTLALHHRRIPGTLHFEKPNPRIDFSTTPFFVNRQTIDWASPGGPRRAGVNSLGIGGTNVHAILEEAPTPVSPPAEPARGPSVVPLSARQPAALRELASRYALQLADATDERLEDLAFTAQVGRAAMPVRAAFVADSREDLVR
ncbi:MAG TPA: beta-ketoacyl synthase N-terminal-like domain-containing protein, partial [Opitutus sp.]|nr:beta-ketoacyl synthase N-terminal-like domain-containing protein [Opitutus sp.]